MTFYGFTDNMSPMERGRVEKSLQLRVRHDGSIYTSTELVRKLLKEGGIPKIKEDVCTYYYGHTSKPKIMYCIYVGRDGYTPEDFYFFVRLTKTQYNFALYLLDAGIVSDEAAANFIEAEQRRVNEAAAKEAERVKAENEKNRRCIEEKEEFDKWVTKESIRILTEQPDLVKQLETIFLAHVGTFSTNTYKLLVLIEHIDNPRCKEELCNWLSPHNKASRAAFQQFTGLKLPSGRKATHDFIMNLKDPTTKNVG